jgi:hypothetical protein
MPLLFYLHKYSRCNGLHSNKKNTGYWPVFLSSCDGGALFCPIKYKEYLNPGSRTKLWCLK